LLLLAIASVHAASPRQVRVLMWDEQQPEQKRAYGEKFLGETIAAYLAAQPGFTVRNVSLTSPSQGLDETTLQDTDVVIWWSHQKNASVTDENVERLVTQVRQGRLGFIGADGLLHLCDDGFEDEQLLPIDPYVDLIPDGGSGALYGNTITLPRCRPSTAAGR